MKQFHQLTIYNFSRSNKHLANMKAPSVQATFCLILLIFAFGNLIHVFINYIKYYIYIYIHVFWLFIYLSYTTNICYEFGGSLTGIMIMGGEARNVVWVPCTSDSECQYHCSTPVYHCINSRCVCSNNWLLANDFNKILFIYLMFFDHRVTNIILCDVSLI